MSNDDARRYPVGRLPRTAEPLDAAKRESHLEILIRTPGELRALVQALSPADLSRTYRDGGWTVRQIAHHLPDSHMNAYIRMKLAATEDAPLVKTY